MIPDADTRRALLAQPTRARLVALLGQRGAPTPTEELARDLGLHPNGVRTHLERLAAAGLVERLRVRRPRGRPRDEWALAPGVRPEPDPRPYADLGRWLARAVPPHPEILREVEQAGREAGRELAPPDADSPAEGATRVLTALGFAPVVERLEDGFACTLANCPYRDAAREGREVVCTLHRGLTAGLVEALAPGARLSRFVAEDPDVAGCRIEVEVAG